MNSAPPANVKTINLVCTGIRSHALTVETSPNGLRGRLNRRIFTDRQSGQLTLNVPWTRSRSPDRYPINDSNGNNRWILESLRVFGNTGVLNEPAAQWI